MAGEHDFAPMSDEAIDLIGEDDTPFFVNHEDQLEWIDGRLDEMVGTRPHPVVAAMAREIRASRAAMLALVEAEGGRDYAQEVYRTCRASENYEKFRQQYNDACAAVAQARTAIRALVAHVEGNDGR